MTGIQRRRSQESDEAGDDEERGVWPTVVVHDHRLRARWTCPVDPWVVKWVAKLDEADIAAKTSL